MKISTVKDIAILAVVAWIIYKICGDWFPALKEKLQALADSVVNTWKEKNMHGGDGDIDRDNPNEEEKRAEELAEKNKKTYGFDYWKNKNALED